MTYTMDPVLLVPKQSGSSSSPLLTGLAAAWRLEDTNWLDSHGTYNLTVNGTMGVTTGKSGNGADFSSGVATNYLKQAALSNQIFSGAGTVTFWVKRTASTTADQFVSVWKQGGTAADISWQFYWYANLFQGNVNDGSTTKGISSGLDISLNAWHFCGIRYDGNTTWKLTVDGTTNTATANGPHMITTQPFAIGSNLGQTNPMNGIIDEVYIWNRELSDSEMAQLAAGNSNSFYPFL